MKLSCSVAYDAFGEFTLAEFQNLKGYSELTEETKLEVALRRVRMLEALLEREAKNPFGKQKVEVDEMAKVFRPCSAEERALDQHVVAIESLLSKEQHATMVAELKGDPVEGGGGGRGGGGVDAFDDGGTVRPDY